MEPTSLIIGSVLGAGAVALFGKKKSAPRKPRATTAKKRVAKKPVARKKAPAKKPTAKKAVAKKKAVTKGSTQTGTSVRGKDRLHQAKKPGKRVSASGNVYFESRANRSDKGKFL
jgi:hypothetical protein